MSDDEKQTGKGIHCEGGNTVNGKAFNCYQVSWIKAEELFVKINRSEGDLKQLCGKRNHHSAF